MTTGGEEREVLGVGSILFHYFPLVKKLLKTVALYLHKHKYIWVVKIRNTSEAVLTIQPLAIILSIQYDSIGEFCGPHTASSVFLILVLCITLYTRTKHQGTMSEVVSTISLQL